MPIPVENVLKTLRQLNISKSTGLDKIPAKMLRIATDIIASSLTFKLSVSTGVFVDGWKDTRVVPIYMKEGDRRNLGNCRPISILLMLRKVFEKKILDNFINT